MNMLIDKLVKDWAWRVNDGCPDPSKKDHLDLLEQTLRAGGMTEEFIKQFISEIDFSDKADFVKYKSKHTMRPTTKISIGGKDTTAGEADPKKDDKEDKETAKLNKKKEAVSSKASEKIDNIAFSDPKEKEIFTTNFDKLINGDEISKESLEVINKYARIKDTESSFEIYLANREGGDFRQGARDKVSLGGSALGKKIKQQMIDNGMQKADPVTSSDSVPVKIAGKVLTGGKMAAGEPRVDKVTVSKDESGKVNSVTIGKRTMKKLPVPDKQKLSELSVKLEQLQRQNPDTPKDEIESQAERTVRAINRRNKMIDKYAESDEIAFVTTVEGGDTTTKEGREKICKEYPNRIAGKIKELVGDNPSTAESAIVDRMQKLGDIEDSNEYEKESMAILASMNKIASIRKGAADLTESMVYLALNKKGIQTELPAGETVKVSDIVSFSDDSDINPKDPDYLKQVASKGAEYVVTMEREGGVSVKMDGGAASGARAKMEITEFRNAETKAKALELVDNHNNFIGTKKDPTTSETIAKGKKLLDETEQWAKDSNLIPEDFEPMIGKRTTRQWSEDTVKLWESKGQNFGTPEEKESVIEGLNQYSKQGVLLQEIHNNDIEEQPYGNINVKLARDGSKGDMEITDGITTASLMKFTANPGFSFLKTKDGRTIPRPGGVYAGNLIHSEYNHETKKFEASH